MMNDRDRLIELVYETLGVGYTEIAEHTADYLLANGVIVPLCKVGDTVYVNTSCDNIRMRKDDDYFSGTGAENCPFEYCCGFLDCYNSICDGQVSTFETTVKQILVDDTGVHIFVEDFSLDITIGDFGKTVFLTREDAEKALKERGRE